MVELCKMMMKPYHELSEMSQGSVISRAKADAWLLVRAVADEVARDVEENVTTLPVTVGKITIDTEKVTGQISFPTDHDAIIGAANASGERAVLVIMDIGEYNAGLEELQPEADQRQLDLEEAAEEEGETIEEAAESDGEGDPDPDAGITVGGEGDEQPPVTSATG